MISALNRLVDLVEEHLTEELDVPGSARALGTTEYHLRRMFSSLAGMPLSEYVRRRRMTVAAADVVRGEDDLLGIAVRYGYGSTEAFGTSPPCRPRNTSGSRNSVTPSRPVCSRSPTASTPTPWRAPS
jgi:AraC-like DNA-binding protein